MDLDLLDETYPMGQSNLPFKDFVQGGLTGVEGGLTGLAQTCHFWVSTISYLSKEYQYTSDPLLHYVLTKFFISYFARNDFCLHLILIRCD
jgi:hypothetical protein